MIDSLLAECQPIPAVPLERAGGGGERKETEAGFRFNPFGSLPERAREDFLTRVDELVG